MKQKFVLTINKKYMGKSKFPNIREFNTFAEMETYKLGVIMGLAMDGEYKFWDLWDFEIVKGENADNEKLYENS